MQTSSQDTVLQHPEQAAQRLPLRSAEATKLHELRETSHERALLHTLDDTLNDGGLSLGLCDGTLPGLE